jgi:hypothetical protein
VPVISNKSWMHALLRLSQQTRKKAECLGQVGHTAAGCSKLTLLGDAEGGRVGKGSRGCDREGL